MESAELYAFLRDPKLLELIELNKTVDDVFDVLTLSEPQTSKVLAWCMNPNEGHSQGDGVIKDFLEAAYAASDDCTYDNRKFFLKWTPGKIRTSSFGAAFVTREFSINMSGGTSKGRLDLFLVDPLNKLLIAIENKVKAPLTSEQLDKYVQAVRDELGKRRVFADYDLAFIVIDKDLDAYKIEQRKKLGTRWTFLDYQWLESSANRARLQLNRGNNAAQLLVAYCESVTQWESPASKTLSDLAADLVLAHPAVIGKMRSVKNTPLDKWLPSTLQGPSGELTLFTEQHRQVCEKLLSVRGVASLVPLLNKAIPVLTPDLIRHGRHSISITCPQAVVLMRDEVWPVYLVIYRVAKASTLSSPKFNVKLVWNKYEFAVGSNEEVLRTHLDKSFNGLDQFTSSQMRRVLMAEHVSPTEAIDSAAKIIKLLSVQIANCPKGR
ncbi:PD-(D/E)XK nuclease family protein [Pseudomonas sp. KFB-139]|uniref:PD-(D/E)XK nuclease family protein n=1 Tax=Pseudomonas serbiensis TaxID=3064350 RepID=A0ABT9CRQ1_9PSED|nr:PD-(D/E)XK nuclease family protein [Pseudomonas sp. KFB-138]MDO7928181.1 PD-(D/E)XK nuclease family protein [Pseudomonas sp. KFB-138]